MDSDSDDIPLERISDTMNRSWTIRVANILRDPQDPRYRQAVSTLHELEDYPSAPEITELILDGSLPTQTRLDLSGVVRGWGYRPNSDIVRQWWTDGDAIVKHHAILSMGFDESDVVLDVASHPDHLHHGAAIDAMIFGYEKPEHQALKIAALDHADPTVRMIAASGLHWDEPLDAELPLIRRAHDLVKEVAVTAISTLRYYPSLRCVTELYELTKSSNSQIAAAAVESLLEVRDTIMNHAFDAPFEFARDRWLASLPDMAAITAPLKVKLAARGSSAARTTLAQDRAESESGNISDETSGDAATSPKPLPSPVPMNSNYVEPSVDNLIALYSDTSGPWRLKWDAFHHIVEWSVLLSAAEQDRLAAFILEHPDMMFRCRGTMMLAKWNDHPTLLQLMYDPVFTVRKSATYALGLTQPNRIVADHLWDHLQKEFVSSTHGKETLKSYVVHADQAQALDRLSQLARHDQRGSIRYQAVECLSELDALYQLSELNDLLADPPAQTWSLHTALLRAAGKFKYRPPEAQVLVDVDNAYVQGALALLD
jgi:YD repeat-containing protein